MTSEVLKFIPNKSSDVVARKIAEEMLLVPIHQTAKDVDSIYTLNETAAIIWDLLDGETTVGDIVDTIESAFEVSREDAVKDVIALIHELDKLGAITK